MKRKQNRKRVAAKGLRKASKTALTFDSALDRTFFKTALTAAEFGYQFAQHGHSWKETREEICNIYGKL